MAKSNPQTDPSQADIREAYKIARAQMTFEEIQRASEKIVAKLFSSDVFSGANTIAVYIPTRSEVSTWQIIQRAWQLKMRVFAPVMQKTFTLRFRQFDDESELLKNETGLREPVDGDIVQAASLDLVLVPLVAFDPRKNRIGMGGGYYDRTFSFLRQSDVTIKPVLAGLAFDRQRVEEIAPNPWDIPLSCIFTESQEL